MSTKAPGAEPLCEAILDGMTDAVRAIDVDTLRVLHVNAAYCALFGCSPEEARHRDALQQHPAELRGRMDTEIRSREARWTGLSSAVPCMHGSGAIFFADIAASVVATGERTVGIDVLRKVLAPERVREASRRSGALLVESERTASIGHYDLNVATGRWTSSETLDRILGIGGDFVHDVPGWIGLIHPEDRDAITLYFQHFVLEQHNPFDKVYRIQRPIDGATRWVQGKGELDLDAAGNVNTVYGTIQDVTERMLMEQSLATSEERFRTIIEQSPISMAIVDLDGTIEYINRRAIETFGYLPTDIPTMDRWWVLAYPDAAYRDEVIAQWTGLVYRAMSQNREIERREYRVTCRDRTVKTVVIFGVFVTGKVFVMFEDVSERKRAEDELRDYRDHLEELVASRTAELESVNQELESFAYSVSHDLRAPLRGINGFSRVLLEEYSDRLDEQGRRYLGRLCQGANRMGLLIDGLLQLARTSRGELQRVTVNLSEIASEIAAELQEGSVDRRVRWNLQGAVVVKGDPRLLRTLLQNLFGNAWKFSTLRDSAEISFGMLPHQESSRRWHERRVFFVRDNGAGFDMAHAGKLFGAFERLHHESEFPGTGIGLATVHRIVQRHGGRIWAEGVVGEGATFYFTLA